jgi:hypothetical protein
LGKRLERQDGNFSFVIIRLLESFTRFGQGTFPQIYAKDAAMDAGSEVVSKGISNSV